MKIKFEKKFPFSIYSVLRHGGRLYVGGSDWDRRKIKYTKKIARSSKGILYIISQKGNNFKLEKKITFPSMVYSVISLSKDRIFVGCKSDKKTLNILDSKGNILLQKGDSRGKGVYNALYSRGKIFLTTRRGKLTIVNSKTLNIEKIKQLSNKKDRLWSLNYDKKRGIIYAGDYVGNLYSLKKGDQINKINIKKFHKVDKKLEKFGPSIWGLSLMRNKIITGDRWGKVLIFDLKLNLQKQINIGRSITFLIKFSKDKLLLGTRRGKLFLLNLKNEDLKKIRGINPRLQKENAIWEISKKGKEFLICFADGNLLSIERGVNFK